MPRKKITPAAAVFDISAYTTKQEIEARINALQNVRRQTNDIVIGHMEAYFRTLATAPDNVVEAFAVMNTINAEETEVFKRIFCADCTCLNDALVIREGHRLEVAALEEQLQAAPDDSESGDAL